MTSNREHGSRPGNELSRAVWRKSSYSGGNGDCVEVANLDRAAALRDSKNPDGPPLVLPQDTWRIFVQSMKAAWRKSSYSGGNGSCVEVAHLDRAVAVRDSKDPGGPALTFTRDEWKTFTAKIRATALRS